MNKLTKERWVLAVMFICLFIFAHVVGPHYQNWSRLYPFFHWSLFSHTTLNLADVQVRVVEEEKNCLLHQCMPRLAGKEILQLYDYLNEQQEMQATLTPDISSYLQQSYGIDVIEYVPLPLSYVELAKSLKLERVKQNE